MCLLDCLTGTRSRRGCLCSYTLHKSQLSRLKFSVCRLVAPSASAQGKMDHSYRNGVGRDVPCGVMPTPILSQGWRTTARSKVASSRTSQRLEGQREFRDAAVGNRLVCRTAPLSLLSVSLSSLRYSPKTRRPTSIRSTYARARIVDWPLARRRPTHR